MNVSAKEPPADPNKTDTHNGWQHKPGDRVFHPCRIARIRLRRVLGVPALFSIGYGDAGSSIHYGLGFLAGWALMLSYIITMATSAYTIPPYLAYFWPVLNEPAIGTLVSMGIILFLMVINILGLIIAL